jgi:hypothetical protein
MSLELEPPTIEVTIHRLPNGKLEAYLLENGQRGADLPCGSTSEIRTAKDRIRRTLFDMLNEFRVAWKIEERQ